jgi:hypothetical protein
VIQNFAHLVKLGVEETIVKEQNFSDSFGVDLVAATQFQNRNGGFDFVLPVKIEYKSAKWLRRSDKDAGLPPNYDLVWLELKNNYGNPGWLFKEAHCFVFELERHYLVVFAEELRQYVSNLVLIKGQDRVPGVLITRYGRQDELTLVKTLDLISLSNSFIVSK